MNPLVREIVTAIAERYKLTVDDVMGKGRSAYVVAARREALYQCRQQIPAGIRSVRWIGEQFNMDHSTVVYNLQVYERVCAEQEVVIRRADPEMDALL